MDRIFLSALRLHEQGVSIKEIARRLSISEQKTRRILITAGTYTTPTIRRIAEETAAGKTIDEIAAGLGVTAKAVIANMPYSKGSYNMEYPSKNALAIRRCRGKEKENEQN